VGLVSIMPAYYVSWGRYTQLTGLVLLPTAIVFTMRSVSRSATFNPRPPTSNLQLPIAAVSVAGLALTHYRVLIFYGCLLLAYLVYETVRETVEVSRTHRSELFVFMRYWGRAAMVCLAAILLTLPWLMNLACALLPLQTLSSRMQGAPSYNVVPRDLVMVGHNRELIALSVCGLVWGLFKRERAAIVTALWVLIAIVIANPTIFGFPSTWLVNNASLAISLFVPFAILGGYFFASFYDLLQAKLSSDLRRLMLAVVIAFVTLWGAWEMLPIVNPATVLATRDDMAAMDWIRRHAPSDAVFLINVRHWQGGTYVGNDGGYWIPLLTGRETILPPAIYIYGSAEYVRRINDLAEEVAAIESLDEERIHQLLDDNGVTYIYIGARGGGITPQMVMGSSCTLTSSSTGSGQSSGHCYSPVYSNGAVWIFQLRE
jgi:hypothetical protein